MSIHDTIRAGLDAFASAGKLRRVPAPDTARGMVNLSSNDYLGLASDAFFRDEFISQFPNFPILQFSSSSSRLLSGNCEEAETLESTLSRIYNSQFPNFPTSQFASLLFASGYHANAGITPALAAADKSAEFFADKLVHASTIDGLILSGAKFTRYPHNDLATLARLLASSTAENKIIVTESVFSMDGDTADLRALAALKRATPGALLYLDEAHAVGVFGDTGLGLAEETGTLPDIDILVGTFGKALASSGAFALCAPHIREWLVNKARTFIYTTAPAPVNLRWTEFIVRKLATPDLRARRDRLREISRRVRGALPSSSQSQIVPVMCGTSAAALACSERLAAHGFHAPPIRPPTVPEGTARVRLSLSASLTDAECDALVNAL